MHVISGSFHMQLVILGGGEEEKTSDGGTFLVGKVCHLAAYATALTHSPQPICRDAERGCGRILPLTTKGRHGTAGREKTHHRGSKINLEATCGHGRQGGPRSCLGRTGPLQRWITTSLSGERTPKHHPWLLNIFAGSISSDEFRAPRLETRPAKTVCGDGPAAV